MKRLFITIIGIVVVAVAAAVAAVVVGVVVELKKIKNDMDIDCK